MSLLERINLPVEESIYKIVDYTRNDFARSDRRTIDIIPSRFLRRKIAFGLKSSQVGLNGPEVEISI